MDVCDLPHDVLVMVGTYMTRRELNEYALACSKLNKACNDDNLWRKLYLYDYGVISNEAKEQTMKKIHWKKRYHERYIARATDVVTFNANPTVIPGIDVENTTPYTLERYALSFLQEPKVSRAARGIYLSSTHTRLSGLLGSYFDTFDFQNQTVLESLTALLNYLQFPSHFSVITKFMLYFAERYYACNKDSIFKNSDAVYVLAFGIIMLNTDMHNSAVKNKMTLTQYIHNSSGINNGENLPEKMLSDIYTKVKEKPLAFNKTTPPQQFESRTWTWVSDWFAKLKK